MKVNLIRKKLLSALIISSTIVSVLSSNAFSEEKTTFDYQGHRGERGLLPENSIPGFLDALDLDITTLELDTVISKDKKVVVSHDVIISSNICSKPSGEQIKKEEELNYKIYQMNYSEIKNFDCGKNGNPRFPEQKKLSVFKPLLEDVIKEVEAKIKKNNLKPVFYNIETKSAPKGDKQFHPEPKEFVELLYKVLKEANILDRVIIQSFDVRTLQELKKLDPKVKNALLVENRMSFEDNIKSLGFNPDIYSPEYILVNEDLIKKARDLKIKVIPWTINNFNDIRRLKELGVDGVISDYPNLFKAIKELENN